MKITAKYPRVVSKVGPRILFEFCFIKRDSKKELSETLPISSYNRLRDLVLRLNKAFRLDIHVEGYEKVRSLQEEGGTFFVTSNHMSDYDPLLSLQFFQKPISFVAKEETRDFPFIGASLSSIGGLFLPRADLRASLQVMKTLEGRLSNGFANYLIYPEGTRNKKAKDKGLLPYHPGSFKSAMRAKVAILPMAIYGTFRVLSPSFNAKRIPIEVCFFDPIFEADYEGKSTEEIAALIQGMTEGKVNEFKRMDHEFFECGYQKIPLSRGIIR